MIPPEQGQIASASPLDPLAPPLRTRQRPVAGPGHGSLQGPADERGKLWLLDHQLRCARLEQQQRPHRRTVRSVSIVYTMIGDVCLYIVGNDEYGE
uniref:Uncharacterized protein n=1 Tax=Aegilops tauschii subsp. strangulata TaxID=200361 RepID=A0A453BWQ2_AEGTS